MVEGVDSTLNMLASRKLSHYLTPQYVQRAWIRLSYIFHNNVKRAWIRLSYIIDFTLHITMYRGRGFDSHAKYYVTSPVHSHTQYMLYYVHLKLFTTFEGRIIYMNYIFGRELPSVLIIIFIYLFFSVASRYTVCTIIFIVQKGVLIYTIAISVYVLLLHVTLCI